MANQASRASRRRATRGELPGGALDRVKREHVELAIEIEAPFCDEAIHGLLDDWLVPMIVDAIIKELAS
jgi:hypothetical protein